MSTGTAHRGKVRRLTITMSDPSMPLNNDGDDVLLVDAKGVVRSKVSYAADRAHPGVVVRFDP